jgi:hypothetical protein
MQLKTVKIDKPAGTNFILGHGTRLVTRSAPLHAVWWLPGRLAP